jgi:hypothetical protein
MSTATFLLLAGALVCFGLAAVGVNGGRVSLVPLGWFLVTLTLLLPAF